MQEPVSSNLRAVNNSLAVLEDGSHRWYFQDRNFFGYKDEADGKLTTNLLFEGSVTTSIAAIKPSGGTNAQVVIRDFKPFTYDFSLLTENNGIWQSNTFLPLSEYGIFTWGKDEKLRGVYGKSGALFYGEMQNSTWVQENLGGLGAGAGYHFKLIFSEKGNPIIVYRGYQGLCVFKKESGTWKPMLENHPAPLLLAADYGKVGDKFAWAVDNDTTGITLVGLGVARDQGLWRLRNTGKDWVEEKILLDGQLFDALVNSRMSMGKIHQQLVKMEDGEIYLDVLWDDRGRQSFRTYSTRFSSYLREDSRHELETKQNAFETDFYLMPDLTGKSSNHLLNIEDGQLTLIRFHYQRIREERVMENGEKSMIYTDDYRYVEKIYDQFDPLPDPEMSIVSGIVLDGKPSMPGGEVRWLALLSQNVTNKLYFALFGKDQNLRYSECPFKVSYPKSDVKLRLDGSVIFLTTENVEESGSVYTLVNFENGEWSKENLGILHTQFSEADLFLDSSGQPHCLIYSGEKNQFTYASLVDGFWINQELDFNNAVFN